MTGNKPRLHLAYTTADDTVAAHRHARFHALATALLAADDDAASRAACRALLAYLHPVLTRVALNEEGEMNGCEQAESAPGGH